MVKDRALTNINSRNTFIEQFKIIKHPNARSQLQRVYEGLGFNDGRVLHSVLHTVVAATGLCTCKLLKKPIFHGFRLHQLPFFLNFPSRQHCFYQARHAL
jgi:hypothetical protein